jgi:CPA2 family monovalent cation:H+ antiporter-2
MPMHIPLLLDLLLIFGLAVPVLLVCHRLRIASVVGFLITGVIVGPHSFGIIGDATDIKILAEIGIVFLLFTIGIEFSLDNLLRIKRFVFAGGTLQVLLTIAAVFLVSSKAGLGYGPSVFNGFLLSLSSTAIVLKLLQERAEVESPHGQATLGLLIFQDIVVVPMMILTPFLAGAPGQNQGSLFLLLAKGIGLIALVLLSAKWLVPRILYQITRTRSRELFLLSTLAMCFAVAFLSYGLGLSLALGAFMAGLIVSKTDFSFETLGNIIPFRDVFASLFFVSIGMLLDLRFFLQNPLHILMIAFIVIVVKSILACAVVLVLRYPLRTSILTGLALCQVGEFSFVLFDRGQQVGLLPPHLLQLFLDVSVVTMALTPFIIALGPRITDIFSRLIPARVRTGWAVGSGSKDTRQPQKLRDHLIIVGFGLNGRNLARAAGMAGIPYLILEMNSQTVKRERDKGEPIYYGDAAQEEVLKHANVGEARILVLVISDPEACRRITAVARKENPRIFILVRTRFLAEMGRLYALGANEVIPEEFETSIEIFSRVLSKYLIPRHEIEALIGETRADGYQMFRSLSKESTSFGDLKHYLPDVEVSTIRITEGSPVRGRSIGQSELRKKHGVTVLAIRREGQLISSPDADTFLKENDLLILIGAPAKLTSACTLFSPPDD